MDIIIAGNLYGFEISTPRNDASIGLYLRGNGSGEFVPIPYDKSGLSIKGDVKKLDKIEVGLNGRQAIIAAKNNDFMQIVEMIGENE